jgi:DNA-directed RNA polymerase subunit RPC12/RpoP
MGIRFFCEACGTKLNIKDDLAGKKGRCPKCNEKIMIPMQSTLQKTVERDRVSAPVNQPIGDPKQELEDSVRRRSSPLEKSGGEKSGGEKSGETPPTTAQDPSSAASTSSILERQTGEIGPRNKVTQDESAPELPPIPAAGTPETRRPKSAFDEAPNASWFVRPTSGGQFGPADANAMKSWLSEGRVGRDSLVWREGWEEWESAEKIFELEFQGFSEPKNSTPSVVNSKPEATSGSNIAYHQMARKKAKTMGIILIVALLLLSVVLVVVLVLVANGTIGGAPKTENEPKAALSSPASASNVSRAIG